MHNFKDLKVWKAGIILCKTVFELTRNFSQEEKFNLASQITSSAISIPSNIAEGCGRKSNKEFYQFLNILLGSSFEPETPIIIAKEFNYITTARFEEVTVQLTEIQKMITGLQESLNTCYLILNNETKNIRR